MIVSTWMRWASMVSLSFAVAGPAMAHSEKEALQAVAEFFKHATVVAGPTAVDCTLSGGTPTRCFSITVKPYPGGYTPGPWCPTQASDGPDKSGTWLKDGQVLDADGAFMGSLPQRYKGNNWQMVDPKTGKIKVADTREACDAAARPDVDPKYRNYCVQCLPEYLEADHHTYVIPLEPRAPAQSSEVRTSGAGVAFNGVRLDGPAPVDAILGAYTIAPFDDCGGHVNLHAGYHYHAGAPGGNSILTCLSAEAGCALEGMPRPAMHPSSAVRHRLVVFLRPAEHVWSASLSPPPLPT